MCDLCKKEEPEKAAEQAGKSRRIWLWQFKDNVHCPLIDTCLTHQDLLYLTRKLKLQVKDGCQDYDVHAYFVSVTANKCPEAKAIHRLLDDRHAGALRKFQRLKTDPEILGLWNEMKAAGNIAAAFYALMTLGHVSLEVRGIVFGEVHMLSHLMGASYRERSQEVAELKSRLDDVSSRKARVETGLHEALEERDQKILELERQLHEARAKLHPVQVDDGVRRQSYRSEKRDRAVEIARAKARAIEASKEKVESRIRGYKLRILELQKQVIDSGTEKVTAAMLPKLNGTSILYVGGRPGQVAHLEKTADVLGAKFFHHDGGREDAITRIDDVLQSVDCVFCPINCISHDACLRVKAGCKKHGKAFIPLRSSSQTSLRQALLSLDGSVQ